MSNILIAYFSRKGQNYVDGQITDLAKGNTERVAESSARKAYFASRPAYP